MDPYTQILEAFNRFPEHKGRMTVKPLVDVLFTKHLGPVADTVDKARVLAHVADKMKGASKDPRGFLVWLFRQARMDAQQRPTGFSAAPVDLGHVDLSSFIHDLTRGMEDGK